MERWNRLYISLYDFLVFDCPIDDGEMSTQVRPYAKGVLKLLALGCSAYIVLSCVVFLNQLVLFISLIRFLSFVVCLSSSLDISCSTMSNIYMVYTVLNILKLSLFVGFFMGLLIVSNHLNYFYVYGETLLLCLTIPWLSWLRNIYFRLVRNRSLCIWLNVGFKSLTSD